MVIGYYEQPTFWQTVLNLAYSTQRLCENAARPGAADVDVVHCMKVRKETLKFASARKSTASWPRRRKARTAEEKKAWRGGPEQAQNQFSRFASQSPFLFSLHIS